MENRQGLVSQLHISGGRIGSHIDANIVITPVGTMLLQGTQRCGGIGGIAKREARNRRGAGAIQGH